jgi:hypothetical protein
VIQERAVDEAVESDSEVETPSRLVDEFDTAIPAMGTEAGAQTGPHEPSANSQQGNEARAIALRELRRHEVLALMSCFLFPILGAYLLHAIRGQLTRPSEGLVSNYNLTIFVLGAEIRPVQHLIKLILARTLHLQRVVYESSHEGQEASTPPATAELVALLKRVESLETRLEATHEDRDAVKLTQIRLASDQSSRLLVQLRSNVEEIMKDSSRTHKAHNKLARACEHRFQHIDKELNVLRSFALASTNKRNSWGFVGEVLNVAAGIAMLPIRKLSQVINWPIRVMSYVWWNGTRGASSGREAPIPPPRRPAKAGKERAVLAPKT